MKAKSKKDYSAEKYNNSDMNNKLIMNLRDIGHTIRFLFEGKGSQRRVLIILYENGSMTQRELTERMHIQSGSASEVIGKLESSGLILRKESKDDRRTTDIELTIEGQRQAEIVAQERQIRHQEMFACLSYVEKESLLTMIEKLNDDWHERYQDHGKRTRKAHKDHHH